MTDWVPAEVARTYNEIARNYRESTELPLRVYVDRPTVLRLAGPLEGKRVLDLACGEGHYSRLLKQNGAKEVLGVDISREMIMLAEEEEAVRPLGCLYQEGDVMGLSLGESFDLVVGVYLLNYAADRNQLRAMCGAIARHLKPGGRFVGLNSNMLLGPGRFADYRKYQLQMSGRSVREDGEAILIEFFNRDGTVARFENYYLSPETYKWAFDEVGLHDFSWQNVAVSEAGLDAFPDGYWDALLAAPATIGMVARK
ncbi:MAG: class I SAM-dependent methyltransferase [Pseudomonadota bacterium]